MFQNKTKRAEESPAIAATQNAPLPTWRTTAKKLIRKFRHSLYRVNIIFNPNFIQGSDTSNCWKK